MAARKLFIIIDIIYLIVEQRKKDTLQEEHLYDKIKK